MVGIEVIEGFRIAFFLSITSKYRIDVDNTTFNLSFIYYM